MNVTAEDFRQRFELLSDEALLDTNKDELIEIARQCLDEEIARRGLNPAEPATGVPFEEASHEANISANLVLVATFLSGEELNMARGLLDEASIPYHVVNPLAALGGIELRLMVPAELEQDAIEILSAEISEEELAAQAEAAGFIEADAEENEPAELEAEELSDRDH